MKIREWYNLRFVFVIGSFLSFCLFFVFFVLSNFNFFWSKLIDFSFILITLSGALFVYFNNQRDSHNHKIIEQINLIEGLLSELNFIQEDSINWRRMRDIHLKLDSPITKIHIENYISKINSWFFNKIGFWNINRINEQISQLDYLLENKEPPDEIQRNYICNNLINGILIKIVSLRNDLNEQEKILRENLI